MSKSAIRPGIATQRRIRLADIPLVPTIGMVVLFAAAFFNLVDVQREKETISLDFQVLIKLAICGAAGLYGLVGWCQDRRIRQAFFHFPLAWITIIMGFYLISVATSLDPVNSFASLVSLVAVTLAVVTGIVQLGRMTVVRILYAAGATFVGISWVLYFVYPELGLFAEPLMDGSEKLRMAGLAHPNTLGQYSAVTFVLGVVLWVSYGKREWWRLVILAMALGGLIMSLSRGSMIGAGAGLVFAYRATIFRRENAAPLMLAASVLLALIWGMVIQGGFTEKIEAGLTRLSKSGDIEELTTATGRSEIWAHALDLISQKPMTGYGATTSKVLMDEYSSYTHNLVLNVALSTGVLGGLATLLMCLGRLVAVFRHPNAMMNAIVMMVLVNGLVENVIFENLTGLNTMLWLVGLTWLQFDSLSGENTAGGTTQGSFTGVETS